MNINKQKIAIIDYGMGNVGSISNMLKKVGAEPIVATTPPVLEGASKIILPGVGSFDRGMDELENRGFRQALDRMVLINKVPILGICLGMQLFTNSSDEGGNLGLGWFNATTIRFQKEIMESGLRVPHMGWNLVTPCKRSWLFEGLNHPQRFYFLHGYHVMCEDKDILARTSHGYEFVSAISRGNITGVQFHPEKSHLFGMDFFRRFVNTESNEAN